MELEVDLIAPDDGTLDAPLLATVVLGLVAALLVGLTVVAAVRTGAPSVAAGFALAVAVFLGTVGVFELGQRVGSR